MGLETAPFINSLNAANPVGGTDTKSQGDDHIRLIKAAIKATFPNITGAVTLTQAQLNAFITRNVIAGDGLTGGGTLDADRTFNIGTPGTLTLVTTNAVTADSHTHDVNIPDVVSGGAAGLMTGVDKAALDVAVTFQDFTASGTWTKPTGCKKIMVEGCGGGGGSGGVDGQGDNTSGASGGGGSGFSGKTAIIDVTALASGTVTIGAAGAAGTSSAPGGNGGNTTLLLNAITYTWPGGFGSTDYVANGSVCGLAWAGPPPLNGTNVIGSGNGGHVGIHHADIATSSGNSGQGGSSAYGSGGEHRQSITPVVEGGLAGTGFGSGAGGALVTDSASNANGAAGKAGFMRVWEFY